MFMYISPRGWADHDRACQDVVSDMDARYRHLISNAFLYIACPRISYALDSSMPQSCPESHHGGLTCETLAEFEQRFATESACRAYLAQLRWPTGFCCPQCTTSGSWTTTRCLLMCRRCGYQASVTAGTIFHRTRLPLQDWFRAMWWMTDQKQRLSALGLQRLLGIGSYRTAWSWLQKLRRALVLPDWDRLGGQVEVDEIHMGRVEAGGSRRSLESKALVAIATQIDGKGIGRIRLRRISCRLSKSAHRLRETRR